VEEEAGVGNRNGNGKRKRKGKGKGKRVMARVVEDSYGGNKASSEGDGGIKRASEVAGAAETEPAILDVVIAVC